VKNLANTGAITVNINIASIGVSGVTNAALHAARAIHLYAHTADKRSLVAG
jgi:hypothetical protein